VNLQYNGEESIAAGVEAVWAFVTDPEKVGRCFPDVIDVTVHDPTHFEAVVRVGVGPVRGRFKLKVELMPAPSERRIALKISGGGFGSAVDMTAAADVVGAGDALTLLKWQGQAVARGPVATVGGRVLDAQAKRLIDQAFGNVRRALSGVVPG
jgi:carbon monoxide dehydrogenase subunit G